MSKATLEISPIRSEEEKNKRTVKSDETMITIIEVLCERESATLSEIADRLNMAKSAVFKHLTTLRQQRFVVKDDDEYRLGLRFLGVGQLARERRSVYEISKPKVNQLAEETGEAALCVIEENEVGVFLCRDDGNHAVEHDAWSGKAMHLHYLSAGLAMMAYMPDEKVGTIIDKYGLPQKTEQTIADTDRLFEELEKIRQQRIYIDHDESVEGLSTVSAPLLDDSGSPIAGLTIAGPTQRFTEEYIQNELRTPLLTAANEAELDYKHL